ncbi:MAG: cupredoxin domain-containing protein [Planctomycetota bacterium]
MKTNERLAVFLIILATIGVLVGVFAIEKYRRGQLYTVQLTARVPENGNWYPRQISVPAGEKVRIYIRNIETITHGFAIPDFEVAVKEIKAGEVVVVEFTPDKKGTFPFMCTVWCSDHHLDMTGELIVE